MNKQVVISLLATAISFIQAEYDEEAKAGSVNTDLVFITQVLGAMIAVLRGDMDSLDRLDITLGKLKDKKDKDKDKVK